MCNKIHMYSKLGHWPKVIEQTLRQERKRPIINISHTPVRQFTSLSQGAACHQYGCCFAYDYLWAKHDNRTHCAGEKENAHSQSYFVFRALISYFPHSKGSTSSAYVEKKCLKFSKNKDKLIKIISVYTTAGLNVSNWGQFTLRK